jgi:hypothetical protein
VRGGHAGKSETKGRRSIKLFVPLASNYPELTSKELWPHLFAQLDELGLSPEEVPYGSGSAKSAYACEHLER